MIAIDLFERFNWPWVPKHGLTVRWFDEWSPVLEKGLRELPESTECPRSMLAALMKNPSRARKCAALVTEGDRPVAVIVLRRIGAMRWDTVGGGGVAPRFVAHALDGYLFPALSALGVNVHVPTQPQQPPGRWVQGMVAHPVFQIPLTSDFRSHWKATGHLNTVRRARKRTQGMIVELDGPGAPEWVIRGWAGYWRTRATASEDDLVLASQHYKEMGRFHTIRLLDGREPVSGSTWLVLNEGVLLVSTFTQPEYRWHGAGTRSLETVFEWAADAGFKHLDMGVGHDYKSRWAPANGTRWSYDVRPWHLQATASLVRWGANVRRSTLTAVRQAIGIRHPAPLTNE